jgi:hypothetical protein
MKFSKGCKIKELVLRQIKEACKAVFGSRSQKPNLFRGSWRKNVGSRSHKKYMKPVHYLDPVKTPKKRLQVTGSRAFLDDFGAGAGRRNL